MYASKYHISLLGKTHNHCFNVQLIISPMRTRNFLKKTYDTDFNSFKINLRYFNTDSFLVSHLHETNINRMY